MSSRRQRARDVVTEKTKPVVEHFSNALEDPTFKFASLMTMSMALLAPTSSFGPATTAIALAGILLGVYNQRWYWPTYFVFALSKFVSSAIFSYDNHEWLLLYWLLALSIFVVARASITQLKLTARLLIGFTFVFATAWKIFSVDFRTGAFFEFASNTEDRLTGILRILGLSESGTRNSNLDAIFGWQYALQPTEFTLTTNESLTWFWMMLTIATIIIEASIAIVYLVPLAQRYTWWRDAVLTGFAIGTYVLVPVVGFGNLLCILGFTASDLEMKKRTWLYGGLTVFIAAMTLRDTVLGVFFGA